MGERNFTKKKPGITLTVTPVRRKLAVAVVVLTIGTVAFESEVLDVFSSAGSVADGNQPSDPFSDLELILEEFGDDEESPSAPRTESEVGTQSAAADDTFPMLIPSADAPTAVSARPVSFPRQLKETSGVQTDHGQPPSALRGSGAYSFHATNSDQSAAATGIRFTGDIQPNQ